MRRYESYKASGVEWLGDLPSHWEVTRAKRILYEVSEKNHPDARLLSVTQDKGVVPRDELEQRVVMPIGQLQTFKLVRSDDFVISLRSFQGGIEYSEHTGLVSPAYTVLRKRRDADSRYLKYLFKSSGFISELNTSVTGIRQGKNIDFREMSYSFIPIPAKEEQKSIADFLDQKTAEIDSAIAKKERLIDLLQEQRSILINRAVTRGIRSNVPMQDSGVSWIGNIPDGWSTFPVTKYTRSVVDYRGKTPEKVESGVFLVTAKNIKKGRIDYVVSQEYVSEQDYPKIMSRGLPEIGDLLFTTEAPLGEVALVDREDVAFAQRIIKLRLRREHLVPSFVAYAMTAQYFQSLLSREATGSTALGIKASKLHKLKVVAPPVREQERIAKFLDECTSKIEGVMQRIRRESQILASLKSNLIAAVVTGRANVGV